ncbi:MAG: prepilin-type N-terminal cleavage/methylation domain-containing protein [Spongiibacteraceae bacterium]
MRALVKNSRGFTLVEIIVSIVAFGVLMALITGIFAPQVVRGTDPLFSMRAAELGQSYLEEMLGKRYAESSPQGNSLRCNASGQPACGSLGPDAGETTHTTFDDFDDYNGFTDGSPTTAPTNQNGTARQNYVGFMVTASVVYAGTEIGLPNSTDAKRVDVTITDPRGAQTVFSAYKTNF